MEGEIDRQTNRQTDRERECVLCANEYTSYYIIVQSHDARKHMNEPCQVV